MKPVVIFMALLIMAGPAPAMIRVAHSASSKCELQKPKLPPAPKKLETPPKPKDPSKPKDPPKLKGPKPVTKPKSPPKPRWP